MGVCVCAICLTVVFLLKEGPQLVGSLLGRVLIFWELALLLLRDQLKYGLGRKSTQTNVYKYQSLSFSFVVLAFLKLFHSKDCWVSVFAAIQLDMKILIYSQRKNPEKPTQFMSLKATLV